MTIIRVATPTSQSVRMEKTGLEDLRLSFRARGILAFLLAQAETWEVTIAHLLTATLQEGRDALMTALKELERFGYLQRLLDRTPDGKLQGYHTVIYEIATCAAPDDRGHTARGGTPDVGSSEVGEKADVGLSEVGEKADVGLSEVGENGAGANGNPFQDLPTGNTGNGLFPFQGVPASLDPSSSQIPPDPSKKNLSLRESQKDGLPTPTASAHRVIKRPMPDTLDGQEALKAKIFIPTFQAWIATRQLEHLELEEQWDAFVRKALANGYRYASWYNAFQNWLTSPYQAQPPSRASPLQARQQSRRKAFESLEALTEDDGHDER